MLGEWARLHPDLGEAFEPSPEFGQAHWCSGLPSDWVEGVSRTNDSLSVNKYQLSICHMPQLQGQGRRLSGLMGPGGKCIETPGVRAYDE